MKKLAKSFISLLLTMSICLGFIPTTLFAVVYGEMITVKGSVTWDDLDESTRPDSIELEVYVDGKHHTDVTASKNNGWNFSFDVSNYADSDGNAKDIEVRLASEIPNYTTSIEDPIVSVELPEIDGGWVKEEPCSEKKFSFSGNILVAKKGNDIFAWTPEALSNYEQDMVTKSVAEEIPELYNKTHGLDFVTGYSANVGGVEIKYNNGTVSLSFPKTNYWSIWGHGTVNPGSVESSSVIVNNTLKTVDIQVSKEWTDDNDRDGKRPDSVTVNLLADGEEIKSAKVESKNDWTYTFTDLVEYNKDGKEIVYTIEEEPVAGYESKVDGYIVENIHAVEKIDITVDKTWKDNDNQDGIRPESITVKLLANGEQVRKATITEAAGWTYTFTDLYKYENGEKITYTVSEVPVDGYTSEVIGNDIVNTHEVEKIDISGSKTWDDADNQDGIRPESITINLIVDGKKVDSKTVTEADGWAWKFSDLDKFAEGTEIAYTVTETTVDGYETTVDGYNVTNTHTPEVVTVEGKKTWNDSDNQDGKRPASITIRLYADGTEVDSKTVTAANGWTWKFENLAKYENGKEIEYTISEDKVEGYSTVVNGYNVTNTHIPSTVDISGSKTWKDGNNQDGIRPSSITVNLLAVGKVIETVTVSENTGWAWSFEDLPEFKAGNKIVYTVSEEAVEGYKATVDGYNIINTHTPEVVTVSGSKTWNDDSNRDGKRPESITVELIADGVKVDSKEVTAKDNWEWTFEDLPKYSAGKLITYTIGEIKVEGYTTNVNGFDLENSYTPERTSVSGSKTWNDNNNQDGIRPESIIVNLLANGTKVDSATVTAENGWSWTFENLYKFENGQEITYTVSEEAVEGYKATVEGFNITNTHEIIKIDISGSKTWDDDNNRDGLRPESITINLWADGNQIASETISSEDDWTWNFKGLDKFAAGKEIKYEITENTVEGYETKVENFNVTNTYVPAKTEVSGSKTWDDDNNRDGKRPSSITINLLANGEIVASKTVTANDNWAWTFNNLFVNENGQEIVYTITEDAVDGYESSVSGFDVTNTHTPEVITVSGSKTWNDDNNRDGLRPESITVYLRADGETIAEKTVTEADDWAWTFENLNKYSGGREIIYSVSEKAVEGYTTKIEGYDITNTHVSAKTEISGSKTWNDNDNQDGVRPASITVNLLADGEKVDSKTVTANDNWSWTFEDLFVNKDGKKIVYTIEEITVNGYESKVEGYNITNTHVPSTIEITGSKKWNDDNNRDGLRPESIEINLLADGEVVRTVTVSEKDGWDWKFENLPEFKAGNKISYTITEVEVEGYESVIEGYNVINTHEIATVDIEGSKVWDDADDQDGLRPESITINLLANGEVIKTVSVGEKDRWAWKFENLPEFESGEKIDYSIEEIAVEGYKSVVEGNIVTNTHTPATVEIKGIKTWNDKNNQDGVRPEFITINLLADGEVIKTVTVSEADGWAWKFENLPVYRDHGVKIVYSITEDEVANYKTEVIGYNVMNSYEIKKTEVSGTKTWDDADNQDGKRPESITINLLANNKKVDSKTVTAAEEWAWSFTGLDKYAEGKEIVYTITEDAVAGYDSKVNGYNVTNTHTPEKTEVSGSKTWDDNDNQDGIRPESITINLLANGEVVRSATVSAAEKWTWTFTELDKYADGKEIEYTLEEIAVEGYETVIDGFNVTNTHEIEKISISGTKIWDDADNQDGKRPESIVVNLHANGNIVKSVEVTEAEEWAWSFEDLDKYLNGSEIVYTVSENEVEGYTVSIDEKYNITNTYAPEKTNVMGHKVWDDADNQDGIRPESITVNLLKGEEIVATKEVTAEDKWAWNFENLDKYENGKEIVYTVSENAVEGYESSIDGFNVTNTHTPETITVEGNKTWEDADNQDGKRPESITINLLADGEVVDTVAVTEADGWAWKFENLDKYANGKEIVYTITEDEVAGYTAAIDGYNVTNTHEVEKIEISGSKTWNDDDDHDGFRPESITINLLADGKVVNTVAVTEADGWAWKFENLDKYANGKEIVYTITEDEVAGYTAEINGYNVINTHEVEKIEISGSKTWKDANDQDGIRPNSIIINLLANGKVVDVKSVTAKDGWAWKFENLDKYENGEEIVYTITEDSVRGYRTEVNGFNVTNTHTPEVINISGSKVWNDENNQDGKRPSSIVVNLHANGYIVDSKVVTAANNWSWTFFDVDRYSDGEEIIYTVSENYVEGYTVLTNGYSLVNIYAPEKTNVLGHKIWNDNNDQDGIRPDVIKVNLYADGAYVTSKTVSALDSWGWNFTNLDKYANGKEIVYTVTEDAVEGYTSIVDGYNIINTHIPEKTEVKGSKIWIDDNNQAGKRPDSIVINLFANGVKVDSKFVRANSGWTWTFTDLEKYANGKEIIYTVSEEAVDGYTTEVVGYDVFNTYIPELVDINVSKVWNDDDDFDGIRPDSITVHLYADGVVVATQVITEADGWNWTFTGLDKYNGNKLIDYAVVEDSVPYYATYISETEDGNFVVLNEYLNLNEFEIIDEEDVPLQAPATSDFGLSAIVLAIASLVVGGGTMFTRKKK